MESKPTLWVEVDEQGHLVMPPEAMQQYGVKPGVKMRMEANGHGFHVRFS